jgi:hypothetical protein
LRLELQKDGITGLLAEKCRMTKGSGHDTPRNPRASGLNVAKGDDALHALRLSGVSFGRHPGASPLRFSRQVEWLRQRVIMSIGLLDHDNLERLSD